ncbi:MAG: hypothetical protein PHY56_00870 [Candidatus Omnitrophica bacterium]|nr:hypothetical protein [Candidatus Omnitrophota bacterium]
MTRQELLDCFTPIYDKFAMLKFNTPGRAHLDAFDEIEDPTMDYITNNMSGLGAWQTADEDSDTGLDHFIIGYEKTNTQQKYRKYFYVTYEVNEQMEYAALNKKIASASALGEGGRQAVLKVTAAKLYNGFSVAGADGYYTFYDSHPKNPEETGTTYDNLLSGAFSHDNLEVAEAQIANNHFDMDGDPIQLAEKPLLLYPPALAGVVGRVLNERALERPGVTLRDINLYAGKYTPVESIYLSAKMGGSDTAWYIVFPGTKMLQLVWAQKPQFTSWIDNLKQRYYFDGWEHFLVAISDWRFGFASTGL